MSIHRLMYRSVLVVGATLATVLCMACGPTLEAQAQQSPQLQEGQTEGAFCGGIAGFPCAEGFLCVDDPKDDCEPNQGGADCGGICRMEKKRACTGREPGQRYISRDPNQCAVIRYFCEEGFTGFSNDCGCGCQKVKKACDYNDPTLSYVSKDPTQCLAITFNCPEGATQFFNDCGCGCRQPDNACDYKDPRKSYISMDPAECTLINFVCTEGSPFFDRCGCGCRLP
ncbi:MAG TPA: hypothetical protein VF794_33160 [Archangium sp.]|jgi:hypothetical protein|uniref:hypothetical protein n=1 Tax=Archangium sp. TaxID=1872627 RepID=UPI002ED9BF13